MLEGSYKQHPEEEPDTARSTKYACSCSSHLAELGTGLFSGCTNASTADVLQLCSSQSPVAVTCKQKMTGILRASPALGKVAMTQAGWEKDGDSLTGEASALQAVHELVLSAVTPQADRTGGLLKSSSQLPRLPKCWQKNEQGQLGCSSIPGKCSQALQFPCNPAGKTAATMHATQYFGVSTLSRL